MARTKQEKVSDVEITQEETKQEEITQEETKQEEITQEEISVEVTQEENVIISDEEVVDSSGNVKSNEPSVEAPKEKEPATIKLKIEIGFNDKYTNVEYKVGEIIPFEKNRAKELLADTRKLVSKA